MNVDGPLLLGEAPSKSGDRYYIFPLSGAVAKTLCTLAGIPPQPEGSTYGKWTWALYDAFECSNLFDRYAEATPWSAPAARVRAAVRLPDLSGRVVVCLGRNVQSAFHGALTLQVPPVPFHEWRFDQEGEPKAWVTIPHPSALNRMLKVPAERDLCGSTLRRALDLATVRDPR